MRLLVISGEGNALQTAAALATACHAAANGQRVLVASTGPTHRLGSMLSHELGARPLELSPNLAAMEIVASGEIGERWEALKPGLRTGLAGRVRDIGSDELPSFPGIDEFGALLVTERAARSGRFDLLVFDGPSTDSLIRSLALPDTLRWLIRLIFGLDRGAGRSRASQESALVPTTILPAAQMGPLQDLRVVLENERSWLDADGGARVRLVCSVEELSLPSIRQALSVLGLYGVAADMLLVRGETDAVDAATRATFRVPLLVDTLPVLPTDQAGWAERGKQLYATHANDLDLPPELPAQPPGIPENLREVRLQVPFLNAKDLDIALASEEVVVRFGPYRRHVLLPALVSGGKLRARVEGEVLRLWVE